MEWIEVATPGARLHVRVRPGRPTVLFLHGLAGHSGEWFPVVEHLADSVGVVAPDQRGHGRSIDGAGIEVDERTLVDDAIALIEQLAEGAVVVVGQSMGGVVATLLCHARPDLVLHLVLIEADMNAVTDAEMGALAAWFDRWPSTFEDDDQAVEFFGEDSSATPAWVDGLERIPSGLVRRFDPGIVLRIMWALAGTDRLESWSDMTTPTTLLRAAKSSISDGDVADMIAARPDVDVVIIEDSSHDVHLDQPARVAAVVSSALLTT